MTNDYDLLVVAATDKHLTGRDWRLLKAQYFQESRMIPDAVSPAGARGIAQFMPDTWSQWAQRTGYPGADIHDPEASIFTGAAYMAWLIEEWSWPRPDIDRYCLALASYNAGLGNLLKAQEQSGGKSLYREIIASLPQVTGHHSAETIEYTRKILGFYCRMVTDV